MWVRRQGDASRGALGRGQKDWGTGSKPPRARGWQRKSRHRANSPPLSAPNRSTASKAYSEQVGEKRQQGGFKGEMASR